MGALGSETLLEGFHSPGFAGTTIYFTNFTILFNIVSLLNPYQLTSSPPLTPGSPGPPLSSFLSGSPPLGSCLGFVRLWL